MLLVILIFLHEKLQFGTHEKCLWEVLLMHTYNVSFHTEVRKICISIFIRSVITKTCLYNFDPLKPHFYIVKLGFTGVYIIFLIFA